MIKNPVRRLRETKLSLKSLYSLVKYERKNLYIDYSNRFHKFLKEPESPVVNLQKAKQLRRGFFNFPKKTLGINGIWLILKFQDTFELYEDEKFIGLKVSNYIGGFIIAIEKAKYPYRIIGKRKNKEKKDEN